MTAPEVPDDAAGREALADLYAEYMRDAEKHRDISIAARKADEIVKADRHMRTAISFKDRAMGVSSALTRLAEHDRAVKAAALEEAAQGALEHYGTWGGAGWAAWLRDRAAAYREGGRDERSSSS